MSGVQRDFNSRDIDKIKTLQTFSKQAKINNLES
jgi:hypothetical protein